MFLNGDILKRMAKKMAAKMNLSGFCASNGWLDKFKKRHFIRETSMNGEAGFIQDDCLKTLKTDLKVEIEKYGSKNV